MVKPIHCKTLLGHNNLDFSIECLQSFLKHSCDEICLEIFEDGSITPADEERLLSSLKNSVVIRKGERDRKLQTMLADYPACNHYRNSTNYAQKLFDIMLYDNQDVLYIDSDIYFLKKFVLPELDETPVFMYDNQNAYSFTPIDLLKIKIPVFPNVNSGIFYFPHNLFNLSFIEQLINDAVISKGIKKGIPWLEQTIWSFLAAKSKRISYFNPNQVIMADFALKTDADTVAVHLVYYFRTHIKQLRLMPADGNTCSAIALKAQTSYLNKVDFAIEKFNRKIKRIYNG
ncbi:hypothetical protein [Mucilaginibacter arboris]|uniref:Nucleotide-diphospho-sugar transferase domain-containing protein n=1 Tax=Mucilaginibacter arboris TaxID=2682090 RepID=A0A7K1SS88_9SPHI|nr:hypothetical protein [Mucilaginibacter arboris]MVN20178.1 hypothetical protein [Mucilaginibacter arboris]